MIESEVMVQILAGGKGLSLLNETKGQIPKSLIKVVENQAIIDIVINKIQENGFKRIVYSLSLSDGCFGIEIYKHLSNKGYEIECTFEHYGKGNAKAVQKLAEHTNCNYPIFVFCSDMILPWNFIKNTVSMHKNGTFTWLTSSFYSKSTDKYNGLKVRNDGAVVYDTKLTPEGKFLDDGTLKTVTKGGAILIDPKLFINTLNQLENLKSSDNQVDIFWDVIPFLEKLNWKNLSNGIPSLINAVIGNEPIMDIGTPETLSDVRKYLKNEK